MFTIYLFNVSDVKHTLIDFDLLTNYNRIQFNTDPSGPVKSFLVSCVLFIMLTFAW